MRRPGIRTAAGAAGLAVLIALLVIAVRQLDLARVVLELRHADLRWLLLAAACFLAILPLWALQWLILAPSAPAATWRGMLAVVAMTSSVLNTAPLLLGEAAGAMLLVLRTGLTRATALSVLAMDQLFVGLAKAVVIAGAALAVPLPPWLAGSWPWFAAGVAMFLAALVVVSRRRERLPERGAIMAGRIATALDALAIGLLPLRSAKRSGAAMLIALAKKVAELGAVICVQRAFGVVLPPEVALLVLAALAVATLLPLLPSNVGVYEAAVVLAYAHVGVAGERALAMAITQHFLFFACLALPGYPVLVANGVTRRAAAAR